MGNSFLLEINESNRFYVCHICQNQVALSKDFSLNYSPVTGVTGGVFDKVVNVHVNGAKKQRQLGPHTVADVYCNKCKNLLGWKFIEVYEHDPVARKDMVMLQMGKLQGRNGNQIEVGKLQERNGNQVEAGKQQWKLEQIQQQGVPVVEEI